MAAVARRAGAALAAGALLAGCGAGAWREADARMSEAAREARAAGFRPMAGPHNTFGVFTAPGHQTWRVRLDGARSVFVVAGCTAGCTSLDFAVADSTGAALATDTSAGAAPRLELVPPASGPYLVTFRYGPCSTRECRWVAQAHER